MEPLILICETSDSTDTEYAVLKLTLPIMRSLLDRGFLLRGLQTNDASLTQLIFTGVEVEWYRDIPEDWDDKIESGDWSILSEDEADVDIALDPCELVRVSCERTLIAASCVGWEAYHKHGSLPTPFETASLPWDTLGTLMDMLESRQQDAPTVVGTMRVTSTPIRKPGSQHADD
jgi:hypothetical protein